MRLLQKENAYSPISVILSGIVTLVRLLQPKNAEPPIEVAPTGIVYLVIPAGAKELIPPSIIRHLPSSDANLPLNSFRIEQPQYLQPVITQYFASNKSEIWS